jgi:hypothetical protein
LPTPTYTPLATVTLGSTGTSITFSNIPGTYRDLVLISNITRATADGVIQIQLNGDTGSNYSRVWMLGTGSGSGSSGTSTDAAYRMLSYSTRLSTVISQLFDYSATDKHKTMLWRGNDSGAEVNAMAGRWANTAAVTSLRVYSDAGNFASGSTFSLYGIVA